MFKKIAFAIGVCLFSLMSFAQDNDVARALQEVEQNNNELKAFTNRVKSKQLEMKASNNLNNPEVGAYYLPFGTHNSGDYIEFQISQSFEFPTVYAARKNLIKQQNADLSLAFEEKRQVILLNAKQLCIKLIVLNKKLTIEQQRVEQAQKVFEQTKALFEKEQIGVLTFNKAKIAWMQEQFNVQKLELQQQNLLSELKNLNGGIELTLSSDNLALESVASQEAIWQEKLSAEPKLISLQQQDEIAQQELKLNKNLSLPNLTAGYNHQGIAGEYYSGVYGGISIPLFSNKGKVKAAKANLESQQIFTNVYMQQAKTDFVKQFNEYQLLQQKHKAYHETLEGLNSETLLFKAYELGEISFMEYYVELQFYREALNTMLDMEKRINLLQAEILKHQL